jgi:hypothetical protein
MAMNRRYWLSPGMEAMVRITAHLSSAQAGPEEGAAFEKPGRSIFALGTAGVDPLAA